MITRGEMDRIVKTLARRHGPAQHEGGANVDRKNAVPIGVRHFLDRMHLLSRDAARVVDQHIDRAEI